MPESQGLRSAFVHRAAPAEYSRRRTEQFPRFFWVEMRLGNVKRYPVFIALLLSLIDDVAGIGELHSRIPEHYYKAAHRQGFLYKVE